MRYRGHCEAVLVRMGSIVVEADEAGVGSVALHEGWMWPLDDTAPRPNRDVVRRRNRRRLSLLS